MIESYLIDKILKLYKKIMARIHTIKHVRILAFVYSRVDLKLKVHFRA